MHSQNALIMSAWYIHATSQKFPLRPWLCSKSTSQVTGLRCGLILQPFSTSGCSMQIRDIRTKRWQKSPWNKCSQLSSRLAGNSSMCRSVQSVQTAIRLNAFAMSSMDEIMLNWQYAMELQRCVSAKSLAAMPVNRPGTPPNRSQRIPRKFSDSGVPGQIFPFLEAL